LCDNLQLCKYYVEVIYTKGKKYQMWKHVMNLIMIQWKCVSNTKQEWKLTIKIKILEFCDFFNHINYGFWWDIFVMSFFHIHNFFSFIMVCTHLKCYTTSDVYIIMWKKTIEKFNGPKNKTCLILFNALPIF